MKNLNNKNCFDELFSLYPEAGKKFHAWIDAYKEEVKWQELFNSGYPDVSYITPKFHEIPFDMQKGILLRFLRENLKVPLPMGFFNAECMKIGLNYCFNQIELTLTTFNN